MELRPGVGYIEWQAILLSYQATPSEMSILVYDPNFSPSFGVMALKPTHIQ